jgi:hypothetical protein
MYLPSQTATTLNTEHNRFDHPLQEVIRNLSIHHVEFKDETDAEISLHTFTKVRAAPWMRSMFAGTYDCRHCACDTACKLT